MKKKFIKVNLRMIKKIVCDLLFREVNKCNEYDKI